MKSMQAALPAGLVHLRDGAATPENAALARAIADRKIARIGGLVALFVFDPRRSEGGRDPLLYFYKRIKELVLLAGRLADRGLSLDVTIGDPREVLPARLRRHGASVLYVTPDDPGPDPDYRRFTHERLRDFDLVEVAGRTRGPLKFPPYWSVGFEHAGPADEMNHRLLNRFLADPASLESDHELFETAQSLQRHFAEESAAADAP